MKNDPTQLDAAFEDQPSRYVVGIDLGTTNSACAYVDTAAEHPTIQILPVEQRVDWTAIESRDTLPSFRYQLTDQESSDVKGRWFTKQAISKERSITSLVGILARDRGIQMPGRQVISAKSWLSHSGVDRSADLLPWQADDDVELISPVAASAGYLLHLRHVWDASFGSHPLADQDIVLTLPASFDEVARELTIDAAKQAGLNRVTLLEEPQAAFYSWLQRNSQQWTSQIQAGQSILICDIGGGTTDFTLIRVRENATPTNTATGVEELHEPIGGEASVHQESELSLHRVAVGQHLILGGDNLDLALAKLAEEKLIENGSARLTPRQWDSLRLGCRAAKERMLGDAAATNFPISIAAGGSKLIAKSLTVTIDREMIDNGLLAGFFPDCKLTDSPQSLDSGFQEFGLPYASDPAITKHLAAFLWSNRWTGRVKPGSGPSEDKPELSDEYLAARPDWILFNGGVLESETIQKRLVERVNRWFDRSLTNDKSSDWSIGILTNPRLDLAVARGAAYFGQVRRGEGVRIDSRSARSFYLEISSNPPRAICLMPAAVEPGQKFRLDRNPMDLTLGQPVQFPLWFSSLRAADEVGEIVDIDPEQMRPLPPIRTVLSAEKTRRHQTLPVVLEIELTEIGTLQTSVVSLNGNQRWKLDFDVRSTVETDRVGHAGTAETEGIVDESLVDVASEIIATVFREESTEEPKRLMKQLSRRLELSKSNWPPSLLRSMWAILIEFDHGRSKSPAHEARWLNLLGYCLRPGFGFAADDWRVGTTWRALRGKLIHRNAETTSESIILWRRIAGGFTAGQQLALYQETASRLKTALTITKSSGGMTVADASETLRLVGSLELLPVATKKQIAGDCLKRAIAKPNHPMLATYLWTIGRLGARVPTYGPLHLLIAAEVVEKWILQMLELSTDLPELAFALMQLSRKTGDRYRDISEPVRQAVLKSFEERRVSLGYSKIVSEGGRLSSEQQAVSLGETLPHGLVTRQ